MIYGISLASTFHDLLVAGNLPQRVAVMNAFHKGQDLIARKLVTENGTHNAAVLDLLANHDVDYIEVRDLDAGCFDFRIERRR